MKLKVKVRALTGVDFPRFPLLPAPIPIFASFHALSRYFAMDSHCTTPTRQLLPRPTWVTAVERRSQPKGPELAKTCPLPLHLPCCLLLTPLHSFCHLYRCSTHMSAPSNPDLNLHRCNGTAFTLKMHISIFCAHFFINTSYTATGPYLRSRWNRRR